MWAWAWSCHEPEGRDRPFPQPVHSTSTVHSGTRETSAPSLHSVTNHTGDRFDPGFDHCGPLTAAVQIGGDVGDRAYAVAGTPDGAVVGGYAALTAVFGAGQPTETAVTARGGVYQDGFIARYDVNGVLMWVRQQATDVVSYTQAVAFDAVSSRAAAGGVFSSSELVFPDAPGTVLPRADPNANDGYVVSYDASGALEWAIALGNGYPFENVADLAFGPEGELYVVGSTEDDHLVIASTTGSQLELTGLGTVAAGESTGFVVRVDADGTVRWAHALTGPLGQVPADVFLTTTSELGVAGEYGLGLGLDGGPAILQNPVTVYSAFHTTWSLDGDLAAASQVTTRGGPSDAHGDGSVVVLQTDAGEVWGEGPAGPVTSPVDGWSLAAFAADRSVRWLATYQQHPDPKYTGSYAAQSVASRGDRIAVGGYTGGPSIRLASGRREVVIDATEPGEVGPWEPVLTTFDASGGLDCWWSIDGDRNGDTIRGVAFDGAGGVWAAGYFHHELRLNAGDPSEQTLVVPEPPDAFLVRFLVEDP